MAKINIGENKKVAVICGLSVRVQLWTQTARGRQKHAQLTGDRVWTGEMAMTVVNWTSAVTPTRSPVTNSRGVGSRAHFPCPAFLIVPCPFFLVCVYVKLQNHTITGHHTDTEAGGAQQRQQTKYKPNTAHRMIYNWHTCRHSRSRLSALALLLPCSRIRGRRRAHHSSVIAPPVWSCIGML